MNELNGVSQSQENGANSDQDLGNESPPPNERDALSATSRKRQKHEDALKRLIADARSIGIRNLDLSKRNLKTVPNELLELTSLQYLYLEGNDLTHLPDNFFDCLVNLQWLDLRNNYLASLPSAYVGSHRCLRTLLLEDNELKTLPLELGLVSSLHGLNIANNPLEFPPPEVIEKGTQATLTFLRELLIAKSQGRLLPGGPRLEDLHLHEQIPTADTDSVSSDEHSGVNPGYDLKFYSDSTLVRQTSFDGPSRVGSASLESGLIGPVPLSAALHKPLSYNQKKQAQYEKFKRAGALGTLEKRAKCPEPSAKSQLGPTKPKQILVTESQQADL